MILVRIEPSDSPPFPANVTQKREHYLSTIAEKHRERFAKKFDDGNWGNNIGCWFLPAYSVTNGALDALTYAHDIIRSDHEHSDLRVVAIEIQDEIVDTYRVSNMPEGSFARKRSRNPESEYIIPTDLIQEEGELIALIPKGSKITENEYREILLTFETHTVSAPTKTKPYFTEKSTSP